MSKRTSQTTGLPKNFLIVVVIALIVIGGALYYTLSGTVAGQEKIIKIGLIAPLTGPLSYGGNDMKQGALLAVEEINSQGGIKVGDTYYKIELIIEDDDGNPSKATQVMQKLITQDNVFAIVGSYSSSVTLAIQPIIMENERLLVVPVVVATQITDAGYKYTFRVCANQWMQTTQNAEWVYNNLKTETFALLLENSDYGREGG